MSAWELTVCGLLLPLLGLAQSADPWMPFSSKEGQFAISFPGKPQVQTKEAEAPSGKRTVHIFVAALGLDRIFYVTYTDYPASDIKAGKENEHLEGVVKGNVEGLKGKLLAKKTLTVGKANHPAVEVQITLPDGKQVYRARIVLVGTRLYQVVALAPQEVVEDKVIDNYLTSFQLDR